MFILKEIIEMAKPFIHIPSKNLTKLYYKCGINAEIFLMKNSICYYQLKKNINELINSIDKQIPLGKLKEDIKIPLTNLNFN